MQPWQPQQPPPQPPAAWTPQQLPGALPQPTTEDHDLAALSPFLPKVAASLVALAGLCALLGSIQTWISVEIEDDVWQIPPLLDALFGVACIVIAAKLAGARRWAALASLVVSALALLSSSAWAIYASTHGLLAVFILVAPPGCLVGIVLSALSIMSCDRAERARDRLKSNGLELGL